MKKEYLYRGEKNYVTERRWHHAIPNDLQRIRTTLDSGEVVVQEYVGIGFITIDDKKNKEKESD
jgi:hypothetical protein